MAGTLAGLAAALVLIFGCTEHAKQSSPVPDATIASPPAPANNAVDPARLAKAVLDEDACLVKVEGLGDVGAAQLHAVIAGGSEPCQAERDSDSGSVDSIDLVWVEGATFTVFRVARHSSDLGDEERVVAHALPRVDVVQRPESGASGPWVMTVSSRSEWGTQCDPGVLDRVDLLVCALEASGPRCASVPLQAEYFDGCGGAEAYDGVDPELEGDPKCSKIEFLSDWSWTDTGLSARLVQSQDLDCIDGDVQIQEALSHNELVAPLDDAIELGALLDHPRYQLMPRTVTIDDPAPPG